MTQDDFQNNFERINDPTDPPIQSNVDEAATDVNNQTNLAADLHTVSNRIAKEFIRLESENAELQEGREQQHPLYL